MSIEKLTRGVLELDTPIGPRYVQPNFAQRAYLIWIFRNFFSLSQQVLQPWERRLIDRLWSDSNFVSLSGVGEFDRPIIGRIERRVVVQAEGVPIRKPAAAPNSTAAEPSREAASA
ncbi:MAG TPA: hypothetical protein VN939_12840 [Chthoniobacterales bacterium]|jgi:hypothetical protein|nr:hypothetical protein [Chthoniobacterales bacterium]